MKCRLAWQTKPVENNQAVKRREKIIAAIKLAITARQRNAQTHRVHGNYILSIITKTPHIQETQKQKSNIRNPASSTTIKKSGGPNNWNQHLDGEINKGIADG